MDELAPGQEFEREEEDEVETGDYALGLPHRLAPPADDPPTAPSSSAAGEASDGRQTPLATAVILARAGGGMPLPAAIRSPLERSFARDLNAVRLHRGQSASALAKAVSARAVTLGRDVFLNDQAINDGPDAVFLLAHEVAHALQQDQVCEAEPRELGARDAGAEQEADDAAWLVRLGLPVPSIRSERAGILRRDEPIVTAASGGATPAPVASPAVITAFIANPPIMRMSATLEGLFFATEDRGQVDFPDIDLAPTAGVFARLCDTHYSPQLVRDFQATPQRFRWIPPRPDSRRANSIHVEPYSVSDVLAFLDAPERLGPARVAITAQQRSIVLAAHALNPIPRQILTEIRNFISAGGGVPEVDGVLGEAWR